MRVTVTVRIENLYNMNDNRTEIIELLRSTKRPGINKVIEWLDSTPSFFEASAARIHHDNVKGGLASHSLRVFRLAKADWDSRDESFKRKYPLESVIIAALLHDVCKKDVYYIDADGIPQWNEENHRKGHGLRSVRLLKGLGLSLTPDECMAIWWHMGAGNERSQPDYPREYAIAMQDAFCQLIHNADHSASKVSVKEHKEERLKSLSWDAQSALFRMRNEGGRFVFGAIRSEVYKHNMAIFESWKYELPSGKTIPLPGSRQKLLDATKVYCETVSAKNVPTRFADIRTGCANKDCLVIAKGLIDEGLNPAVLNLADAYHACGLYNSGSGAYEESLCRASTLSLTLYQYYNKMWAKKAGIPLRPVSAYPMDIHFGGIYSPGVTVFRDNQEAGFALREVPYQTSIISVAALNFKPDHKTNNLEYRASDGGFTPEGEQVMCEKISTIYRIALLNGHDSLVLGAFGCGVFELKPALMAELFKRVLDEEEFRGKFHTVVFALLEGKATSRNKIEEDGDYAPFYQLFGRL